MNPPTWRKSSRSTQGTSSECVEVAPLAQGIGVRDSKHPNAGHLAVTAEEFAALVQRIKGTV
ncbi:DUF397 domain-containing protein [Thermomonospora umbrina]|uniref:Uncharacterized protein DUF397 n=1 Tax=Thermomonospora umbrina TaxID=111806 RepID=A0A3D9ST72_9ACTN|nr:DUF397 domain-containing protein [Thermomonospora umbrina]REE95764.1 uncharacterized protein DUF397 [Thermomonospora umbrina]